jgi:hypothetical protein
MTFEPTTGSDLFGSVVYLLGVVLPLGALLTGIIFI